MCPFNFIQKDRPVINAGGLLLFLELTANKFLMDFVATGRSKVRLYKSRRDEKH